MTDFQGSITEAIAELGREKVRAMMRDMALRFRYENQHSLTS